VQIRGRLGITIADIDPEVQARLNLRRDSGVVITNISPGGVAASAGFQVGDIVLAVGNTNVSEVAELQRAILDVPLNASVSVRIQRDAQEMTITTTLPAQTALDGLENLVPPELRDRLQALLDSGQLAANQWQQMLRLYNARHENVRVGRVESVNPGIVPPTFIVTFTPDGGDSDISTELRGNTQIRRGRDIIQPADLRPNEFIIVLSQDGGQSAFLVLAFGP
jgi:membrane-associated protease RseP (regulator of RpoE activity)